MYVDFSLIFGPIQFLVDSAWENNRMERSKFQIKPGFDLAQLEVIMTDNPADLHTSTWDPALDAVIADPKHHKVLFESERLRVLDVTLEPNDEEPVHHHRWPSVFVFDQVQGPVHDFAPDGTQLPPNRDVIKAIEAWDGQGCLVVNMAPQPAGRVLNASGKTLHGIRVEMKKAQ
jgi:hypothetical protein